ncbi:MULTISPECIES: hypothetical protein [unclassified Ruegeria]|uniref:hypothetical protein n=1 Tax=unclassified Ruegeria TaxID=2625375 RepID=UPI00148811BC|nr:MULTISPECIES: hypothetical protein [unclassified Ruegeria]
MEITLHFGAHRCATTSFQEYVRRNAAELKQQGVAFWGPETTRETDLIALKTMTDASRAELQHELDLCQSRGVTHLLVSEENFLGMMQQNFHKGELYPEARLRAQLVSGAFGARVTAIALNIRALNTYWASLAGYAARNGKHFGPHMRWQKIAKHDRSWRAVVTDLADVFPGIPLYVLPFEEFAGHPDAQLAQLLRSNTPERSSNLWLSKDEDARPQGLNSAQEMKLMATFADDLTWLADGADGLAQLCLMSETARGAATPAYDRIDERNAT